MKISYQIFTASGGFGVKSRLYHVKRLSYRAKDAPRRHKNFYCACNYLKFSFAYAIIILGKKVKTKNYLQLRLS